MRALLQLFELLEGSGRTPLMLKCCSRVCAKTQTRHTYMHRDNVLVMEYFPGVKLVEAVRNQGRREAQRRNISFEQLQVRACVLQTRAPIHKECAYLCMHEYAQGSVISRVSHPKGQSSQGCWSRTGEWQHASSSQCTHMHT